MGMIEHDQPRLFGDDPIGRSHRRRSRSVENDIHIGVQRKHVGFPIVADTHGRSAGLRDAELHLLFRRGIAALLVEDQPACDQVYRILQLFRCRLVWRAHALRVRLQIDLHFAFRDNISGLRVVLEIVSVDLIEAAGILSIKSDGDVAQFGVSALPVLHGFAGLDLEDGAPLLGAGYGEIVGGLLNLDPQLGWNAGDCFAHTPARVKVRPGHREHDDDRAYREPAAQAGDLDGHLASVYWKVPSGAARHAYTEIRMPNADCSQPRTNIHLPPLS